MWNDTFFYSKKLWLNDDLFVYGFSVFEYQSSRRIGLKKGTARSWGYALTVNFNLVSIRGHLLGTKRPFEFISIGLSWSRTYDNILITLYFWFWHVDTSLNWYEPESMPFPCKDRTRMWCLCLCLCVWVFRSIININYPLPWWLNDWVLRVDLIQIKFCHLNTEWMQSTNRWCPFRFRKTTSRFVEILYRREMKFNQKMLVGINPRYCGDYFRDWNLSIWSSDLLIW